MAEILARISQSGGVELTDGATARIEEFGSADPLAAAYLARELLASAAALSGQNPPQPGAIIGDAHLAVLSWAVGTSTITGDPVLKLSVAPGIELTFAMTRQGAKELGGALIAQTEGTLLPGGTGGLVH